MTDAVRRADWRFLLGRPELGPVELRGGDDELAAAVDALAGRGPGPGGDGGGVVAVPHDRAALREAAAHVPPDGWLWAELRGWHRRSSWIDDVRRAGLSDVTPHWLWPTAAAPTRIVPLTAPAAVELALTRQGRGGPVARVLARALASSGLCRLVVRDVGVVASRSPGAARGLEAWLEASRHRFGLDPAAGPLSCLYLTPRFRASASVIVLVTAGRDAAPRLVVKLPRHRDRDAGLAREAAGLGAAAERGLDRDGSAPRLVTHEQPAALGGWPVLVETALRGPALRPAVVRRRPEAAITAVDSWLQGLAGGAERRPGEERVARLLTGPLEPLAAIGAPERALVDRTLAVCRPLEAAVLPEVLEHGDLSHPNLITLGGGRVGAVDWELAESRGLPLQDLAFFLAYVAGATRRARTPDDHEAAVREVEAETTRRLRHHATAVGVPEALVAPLVAASWARQAAAAWRRTGGQDPLWLRSSRVARLWRRSVEVAEEEVACASST